MKVQLPGRQGRVAVPEVVHDLAGSVVWTAEAYRVVRIERAGPVAHQSVT